MKPKMTVPKIDNTHLTLLFPNMSCETKEKIVYRKNGKSVDKVIEFDVKTGSKVKTTHYDYFDDKKIRSIDEFDKESCKKIRTVNYVVYKSIDEYDLESGKNYAQLILMSKMKQKFLQFKNTTLKQEKS